MKIATAAFVIAGLMMSSAAIAAPKPKAAAKAAPKAKEVELPAIVIEMPKPKIFFAIERDVAPALVLILI
jgi:hypothetical protein